MYTDIKSVVKWEGVVARLLGEWQDVRQGGSSSTGNYKAGKNKILAQQEKNPSLQIGHLNVGAIMVADDLAVAAYTKREMQTTLLIAGQDASRERYKYTIEKIKTIVVNTKSSPDFKLNNKPVRVSNKAHLGICRNHNYTNVDT